MQSTNVTTYVAVHAITLMKINVLLDKKSVLSITLDLTFVYKLCAEFNNFIYLFNEIRCVGSNYFKICLSIYK